MKSFQQTPPNSVAAFRLPGEMRNQIDTVCGQEDITRSQFLRRLINEFLKHQQVDIANEQSAEPRLSWSKHLYERVEG